MSPTFFRVTSVTSNRERVFAIFKYSVYLLLAMNIYWFFIEEYAAAKLQFPGGVSLGDMIEAYAATIDTANWVVLLLMFELETSVLEDKHFTPWVTRALQVVRLICYSLIVYAFYGYVINLVFLDGVSAFFGLSDLCSLPPGDWSYAIDLDEYAAITAANCDTFSQAGSFLRFDSMPAIVDHAGHAALVGLAWIDVINSGVWLLVVLVLEIDVRLQEHHRYEGLALRASNGIKFVLYATLVYAAIYWGVKGDFVDFWDALLWIIAFVFIELNVLEWRAEEQQAARAA